MDLTHKLTLAALLLLCLTTAAMLGRHLLTLNRAPGETAAWESDSRPTLERLVARNGKIFSEVADLLKKKQYRAGFERLREIKRLHPDNPHTLVFRARLQYGSGLLAAALHSYRLAVDRQPDYADNNTPLYIGDEIMDLISEGRGKLRRELQLKPGDGRISMALEDLSYLQRRIAGGCE